MADFRVDHEIVTKFVLDTCRLGKCMNTDIIQGLYAFCHCVIASTKRLLTDGDETEFIPVITGSVAELYIQPMLSCVGDHDIMLHISHELAIPAGTAPPTQLPDEFHSRVEVYEIVDSEFPGYVYLVNE